MPAAETQCLASRRGASSKIFSGEAGTSFDEPMFAREIK
jgi:hypothetical protein